MKIKVVLISVLSICLFCGCATTEAKKTDIDNLVGVWVNEDNWKMEIYEPEKGEDNGQVDLTNWNFYEGTRLGNYTCQESSHRLIITYPDNWNIETMEDVYTYELTDEDTLVLSPDGNSDESVEYSRIE
ncbi:MAG TPA: hypothetical protein H9758_06480 [Candidatus Mediterraneibacter faecipullorum]|uniref:Lipocalin-like domain-containing protein n=1 Tax=Candidatus Mediterraneibacter faecipullorum TaxID=2838670 RepID=A0A9D2SSM5_9FIRM|nr:hypothetical protein [Candidatus Mediterraneibacter faecipullorum]